MANGIYSPLIPPFLWMFFLCLSNFYHFSVSTFLKILKALRLEMQVKRFELFREVFIIGNFLFFFFCVCVCVCFFAAYLQFLQSSLFQPHFVVGQRSHKEPSIRQDVRDLVELTVDRMDVYHLVPWFVGRILCFLEIKFCHICLLNLFRLCWFFIVILLCFWTCTCKGQNVVSTLTV